MTIAVSSVFGQVLLPEHRPDPYPLYARLRETPVTREPDGTYVVSTFQEISALLHDPRISSDPHRAHRTHEAGHDPEDAAGLPQSFLRMDPPRHDVLRRSAMRHFGPPHSADRVTAMQPTLHGIVDRLIGRFPSSTVDIVDDFAYPFPVLVICSLLGVPVEDEPQFREWIDIGLASIDPTQATPDRLAVAQQGIRDLAEYLGALVDRRRADPADDLLSALVNDDGPQGRMSREELVSTALLLLVAGHETTVNLIANGSLALLRNPAVLQRLPREPELIIRTVEEIVRYDGPVQFLPWRTALDDIELAGVTIPRNAPITLVLASGNRDPEHVPDPDAFDPDRRPAQHLGFGDGIHYCFGAPLARLEAQIALTALAPILASATLLEDPPPYRDNPVLRGPRHVRLHRR